jgi:hypothetical protein
MAKQTESTSQPVVLPQSQIDLISGAAAGSSNLYDGTLTAGAAAALPSHATSEVTVQNDPTSTTDIYVGNAGSQSIRLQPGGSISASLVNSNMIFVAAVSGSPRVNWWARG